MKGGQRNVTPRSRTEKKPAGMYKLEIVEIIHQFDVGHSVDFRARWTSRARTWAVLATEASLQDEFDGAPFALAEVVVDPRGEEGGEHLGVALVRDGGAQRVRAVRISGVDVGERN